MHLHLIICYLRWIKCRELFFRSLCFFNFLIISLVIMRTLYLWLFVNYGEIFEKNIRCHTPLFLLLIQCSLFFLALLTNVSFYLPSASVVLHTDAALPAASLMRVANCSRSEGRWFHMLILTHIILHVVSGILSRKL